MEGRYTVIASAVQGNEPPNPQPELEPYNPSTQPCRYWFELVSQEAVTTTHTTPPKTQKPEGTFWVSNI